MTNPDLSGRKPTVQRAPAFPWPRWIMMPRRPASPLARDPRLPKTDEVPETEPPPLIATVPRIPRTAEDSDEQPRPAAKTAPALPAGSPTDWFLRESVALIGMAGAALTVFAQFAAHIQLSRPFVEILGWWMTVSSDFWLAHYEDLGFYPHAHLQAAIALAFFLAVIGLGARISANFTGNPPQNRWGFLEGMTWPSLAIMGILAVIFLLGHDPSPSEATFETATGREIVKYLFAVILMVGYALGDYLGRRSFHIRLYRLAILLILAVALNQALLPSY